MRDSLELLRCEKDKLQASPEKAVCSALHMSGSLARRADSIFAVNAKWQLRT